jgi:hypothetical protein
MQIVLNSSPLIFLAKLGYLNRLIESPDVFYIPQSVVDANDGKISIESLDELYRRLIEIEFRVKRSLFDQIFSED